ncbi:uroporphyrinogen-III synthase [Vibrio europaeus]|uniref:Uroporphyrinogen-III synthase n=1 Tax=Vibrio europaeus TaxID=300876 RepID=A0A178J9F6_9VIBR|nr:uroporphyrinogen-III synthase [Vibrio europaeus]MDC5703282.1 uroporphyrinogen-III synthase [Vibrio europaeus]MDC5707917.1 uroporphyrinogen-III synthase [Vibrio europaeus]MDC5713211.1 uroporphyrinogen-III synthase [Vibrio europaeus]MDC5719190.1 uroporphyrinogen-III synthase [Vibrio europaeus]MDC5722982.1 uroporphyrinogen-III synthase [Vibrio europaeus]
MAVLVTRPGQQGRSLCNKLSEVGIESHHQPLIDIQPGEQLEGLETSISHFDIIIAVSQHAVTSTDKYLQKLEQSWPNSTTYLAVGQKTAHILSKATRQTVHYPEVSDSEHLLLQDALLSIANKKILILRGNGGRELIFDTLVARGAQVEYREVYKRENLAFRSDLLVPIWQNEKITQIVITSSGQLSYFVSQLTDEHKAWLFTLHLYVPSERIAQQAREVGFQVVTNTFSASNNVLLAALRPSETGQ